MLIKEWMTTDVITVTPDTSMMKAKRLMQEKNVGRLPVIDEASRKVVGIISDRDIKQASPSKATTLDMHELHYLLSELKIKDIMTKKPFCVRAEDSVEMVALKLVELNIGGMPVVDDLGRIEGIITDSDLFKVFIAITGIQQGGLQLAFDLENAPGTLKPIVDLLRSKGARIVSILTSIEAEDAPVRRVYIRIRDITCEAEIIEEVKANFPLVYAQKSSVVTNAFKS
ncbi:CBS and ACT domain-containing protein [Desulfovibrio litoralis]|uniref:Acetoin utilization protein AcuB n=1 Tax=Desulfovibrio litoralis DSM 11393 TaxID=1121455 RepID=A0A1M7TEQ7_9BACT|nr:CBS and ACT domain-containing protein [Desulfovibrio litoralis]SHN69254.1 acetoin utilization protein AcuB [Desulfovibrio litoralis DSM 11393]